MTTYTIRLRYREEAVYTRDITVDRDTPPDPAGDDWDFLDEMEARIDDELLDRITVPEGIATTVLEADRSWEVITP